VSGLKEAELPLMLRLVSGTSFVLMGAIHIPFAALSDTLDAAGRLIAAAKERPNKSPEPTP
jgi:hypothetical protein